MLIGFLGQAPDVFGIEIAIIMSGHVVAAWLAGRLVGRFGINRLLIAGVAISALSGLAMIFLALGGWATREAIIAPSFAFLVGFALIAPTATAGALSPFPEMAGRASSLVGFCQHGTGSFVAIVIGLAADGTQMPMAWAMAISGIVAVGALPLVPDLAAGIRNRA